MSLRVVLAGRVGLEKDGKPVDAAGLGRLGRLAFGYLVSARERPVARHELADVLWGEDLPRTWDTSLRVVISKIRSWLADVGVDRSDAVSSELGTYQLHLPVGTVVDVEEAAVQVTAAQAALAGGEASRAMALARTAADALAPSFLLGTTGRWVEQRQSELLEVRLAALEVLAEAALAASEAGAALAAAEEVVGLEPLRESAHRLVMRSQAAAGNRAEALRAYEGLRRLLAEELGLSPSAETDAVYLGLLGDEPATPPGAVVAPAHRLPAPVSSFVGRDRERAELADLVRSCRLVTVAGTGGLGKTRLAIETTRAVAGEFSGGAAMVALGEVIDPDRVPDEVVAALGLTDMADIAEMTERADVAGVAGQSVMQKLTAALSPAQLLLVLDNCEHVVAAAADLAATLLEHCPRLTVLATSREPLRVAGETVWRLSPLSGEDAPRLFRERSRAAGGRGDGDSEAVDELCRRLDGIPLAIELAAARADVLSVPEIVARLDDRFGLLTGGARTAPTRHQTLRAAIDWSYSSLPEREAAVLRRVAVFPGPFTLEAAAQVADTDEVLDAVGGLVARSLVTAAPGAAGGSSRYRLLETIRAYAVEQLADVGEEAGTAARLVDWATALAETADASLDGPQQAVWLDRVKADLPNLRAALAAAGPAARLRLATALARFWEVRGHLTEGRGWLRSALTDSEEDDLDDLEVPPLLRARAHNAAALLAQRQGDLAAARSRFEESLAIRRRAGDRLGTAVALHGLGNLAALQHRPDAARALYEESLAIGRGAGDLDLMAAALGNLGWVAHATSDFLSARAFYDEALTLRRAAGDQHGIALLLGHLGDLAYQQGDYGAARAFHQQSLELRQRLGDAAGRADSLSTLGQLALHSGDLARARSHLEESLALRRELGDRAGLPSALINMADLALLEGDPTSARRDLEEAAEVAVTTRDDATVRHVLVHLGRVARAQGRVDEARRRYAQASRHGDVLPADPVTAEWLEGVAATVAAAGAPLTGARLLGAAEGLRRRIGTPVAPHEAAAQVREVDAVRAALGEEAFAAALSGGLELSVYAAQREAVDALA